MATELIQVYIDTSALREMSMHEDIASLIALSSAGKIRAYISETTLWERGRQQYEKDIKADRIVPYPDGINRYITWFKALFEKNGIIIIPSDGAIINLTQDHIQNSESYFSPEDANDQRDAHVLATAESTLEKSTTIICRDKKLSGAFRDLGFSRLENDPKKFILDFFGDGLQVPNIEKPSLDSLDETQIATTFSESFRGFIYTADIRSHEYLKTLPTVTDKLSAKLKHMQTLDAEIRKRILGYTQWFDPITKDQLDGLLIDRHHYTKDQIQVNAQRLKEENLITETEHYWMGNRDNQESAEILDQAMAIVMPEIMEILDLS